MLLLTATNLPAQVPQLINYQGRVAVGSVNFDAAGQFKFALVNATGTTTYWSNDGTSTAGGQPTAAVPLTVTKGLYSLLLGDVTLTNMSAVPAAVFTNADVRLRVWFNDGSHGFQLLSPDQRLAPNGYLPAGAVGSAAIANGAVTAAKIGVGAVGASAIASGSITSQDFASLAVDTAAIGNAAVTTAKLAPLAVDSSTIADAAITSPKLAPFAVNAAAIADAAITNAKLAPLAVDTAAIANGAVTPTKLALSAVETAAIANSAITAPKIATGAVGSTAIANAAITPTKLAPSAIETAAIANAAITAPKIADGAVGSAAIANAAVTTDKIASGVAINGTFTGPLTGNVTGDVTGNVTGSATYFATPLRGDVVNGQGGSWASVIRLNGIPLKPMAPLHDQVLKYGTSGYWEPADSIPGPIEGDVIGENQKKTKVVKLQGTPIADVAPTAGQLLQFSEGEWAPASTIVGEKTFTGLAKFNAGLEANSTAGFGVSGKSVNNHGVYGETANNDSAGVYGHSEVATGVYGHSVNSHGVEGDSVERDGVNGESVKGAGVSGESENGTGVRGESLGGTGVFAKSQKGTGVYATSQEGTGVHGESTDGFGVFARSTTNTAMQASSTSGIGVYAASTSGIGVFASSGSEKAIYAHSAGNTGVQGASDSSFGVYGSSSSGTGVGASSTSGHAIDAFTTTGWAGGFHGPVFVHGNLTKFSGSFKIDHPQDPANKYLSHSFVESPDMMNIYNGNIVTDADGLAIVTLPDYFMALNRDFRYQLTVIGQFAQAIIAEEIAENKFTIRTDKGNVKVSWQVTGIRQDAYANAHRIADVEEKIGEERGRYLNPELFGQPAEKGINNPAPPARLKAAPATPAAGTP